jgi:hypothetical protein
MNTRGSFERLREWPLATREECWHSYRPAQAFSESGFQRLRTKGHVSRGIRLHQRERGRVQGQERLFSRLNLLSLNARRVGDTEEAERLTRLAGEIETDEDLLNFAARGAASEIFDSTENREVEWTAPGLREWAAVLASICARTDRIAASAQHSPDRFPARVQKIESGVADLVLAIGQHVIFTEMKLSRIRRSRPGDGVFVYLMDLDGADELIKVRPGVDMPEQLQYDPNEVFDRAPVNLIGGDAERVRKYLGKPPKQRDVNLTGLRFVP